MDPRRFLTRGAVPATALILAGCAAGALPPPEPAPETVSAPASEPTLALLATTLPGAAAEPTAPSPVVAAGDPGDTARPYLPSPAVSDHTPTSRQDARPIATPPSGRAAIAAANRSARAASRADAFVGGVQVFAWSEGRVYEVWTAPLRVTTLTLAPGETVTAKAAGDTVRWQIGESQSGAGAAARTHVLIKPLQTGLETNLILTTSQRVYLLSLRSGSADAFNAAVAWDDGPAALRFEAPDDGIPPHVEVAAVTPQGPLDARYRIEARGRAPRWTPTAVFNDGTRTFITLSPEADLDEAPALFVKADGALQLVNYRQADGVLIVDRLFEAAELRLGDRRPQVVRIRRLPGAAR